MVLSLVMLCALLGSVCTAVAEDTPVTLRIVWWGSQNRHDATLKVIDQYMQKHPNVKIEAEYMAWTNYWDKLASQAAASTMPDLFQNDYNYLIVAMAAAAGRTLKMTVLPNMKDQKQYAGYVKPNMYWSVSKDSAHPEEAAKFIDYFTNSVEANEILMADRGVPIASKVREALYDKLGEAEKSMFDYVNDYANYASPMDPPQPAAFSEVDALLTRCEEIIVYGEKSIEDAVDEFLSQAEKAIANTAA